jgi:hypothetical protein
MFRLTNALGIQFTIFGSILLMMNWQPASARMFNIIFGVRIQLSFVGLFYESLGNSSRNKLLHNSFLLFCSIHLKKTLRLNTRQLSSQA